MVHCSGACLIFVADLHYRRIDRRGAFALLQDDSAASSDQRQRLGGRADSEPRFFARLSQHRFFIYIYSDISDSIHSDITMIEDDSERLSRLTQRAVSAQSYVDRV